MDKDTLSPVVESQISSESKPVCPICAEPTLEEVRLPWKPDETRTFSRACKCDRERLAMRQIEAERQAARARVRRLWERWAAWGMMDLSQTFSAWDHENQPAMDAVFDRVLMFAQGFAARQTHVGLLLRGEVKGTGKSHLLTTAAVHIGEEHGIKSLSVEFPVLLENLRPSRRFTADDREEMWDTVLSVPYLALNDIARFSPTEWACDRLFCILEARRGKCTTCMSSNLPLSDWAAGVTRPTKAGSVRMADLIDACRSRIEAACDLVIIPAEAVDYRHLQRLRRAAG